MAQFIVGNALRDRIEHWRFARNAIWLVERAAIGTVLRIFSWLPTDAASATGRRLGQWLGPRLRKHREFRRNLELAFPEKTPAEIDRLLTRVWGNAGAVFAEYTQLDTICRRQADERLEVVCLADFDVLTGGGEPAVVVTAHQANWEMVAAAMSRLGIPTAAPYSPLANPWLDAALRHWREPLGCRLLPRDESIRPVVRELRAGNSYALVMDQRVDSGKPVPFFGMDKMTTLIPARLALRFDCELIPAQVERLAGARFRVTLHPPIPHGSDGDETDKALAMTRRVNEHFEQWVRANPQDWFCSKRRWAKGQQRKSIESQPATAAETIGVN